LSAIEILGRLTISLAIGLLIGLERGWRSRDAREGGRAAGLRTIGLTGLLGGLLAVMAPVAGPALIPIGFAAVALVLSLFQALEARATQNASATGVVAGLLAFAWGAYAVIGAPMVAIAGAVATTAILAFKQPLHRWVRALSWIELRALLVLLIMTALVLPVLPDRAVDPWLALNPRRIWLLTVLTAGVSFVGYFAMRVLGGRGGLMLSALAGGLASSTATTLSFARLARDHRPMCGWLAGGTLIAGAVMGVRVLIMAAAINGAFAMRLAWPLATFAAASAASGAWMLSRSSLEPGERREPTFGNPVEVGSALKFGGLIALIMLLSKLLAGSLGAVGVYGLAAVSGLADVDALTLSVSGMAGRELSGQSAALAVLLAVAANTLTKTVIAGVAGTLRHALLVGLASAAAMAAAVIVFVVAG
jgi:uncharacterized membrane protein (DUF4010 family)